MKIKKPKNLTSGFLKKPKNLGFLKLVFTALLNDFRGKIIGPAWLTPKESILQGWQGYCRNGYSWLNYAPILHLNINGAPNLKKLFLR